MAPPDRKSAFLDATTEASVVVEKILVEKSFLTLGILLFCSPGFWDGGGLLRALSSPGGQLLI